MNPSTHQSASINDGQGQGAGIPEAISGWTMLSLGERPSDGEITCGGGCGSIPRGAPVYWETPHPEYGDCDGYCEPCAIEQGEGNQAMVLYLEEHGPSAFLDGAAA